MRYSRVLKRVFLLGVTSLCSISLSSEITIDIYVSGNILSGPEWQDQNSNLINLVSFNFDGKVAGAESDNVDSNEFNFILRDPNNAGGSLSVNLLTPMGCKLGQKDIEDSDIYLILSNSSFANGSNLIINEGSTYKMKLRFDGSGKYGNAAGLVACTTSGTLTYTY